MQTALFHTLQLAFAGLGQTVLLVFAWCFLGEVWVHKSLPLPDSVAFVMVDHPSETTLVVTLIATLLSVATASFFTIAFKEAFQYYVHKPISLIQLTGGITLAKGGYFVNFRHISPSLLTIAMYALTRLMVSSWATLIAPTLVTHLVYAQGTELSLNSSYFESQLHNQLLSNANTIPQGSSVEVIDIDALLSGMSSAQYSFGMPQTVDFNGISYNVSTGGIIPAIRPYSPITKPVQSDHTGLNFVGGTVPAGLNFDSPKGDGLFSNYTTHQEGLSADVTCFQIPGPSAVGVTINNSTTSIPSFTGNDTTLFTSEYGIPCSQGNPAQQAYAVRAINSSTTSIAASLVCPYPVAQSQLDWTPFSVTTLGSGRYSFLQSTICEITPVVTRTHVTYSLRFLSVERARSRPLTSSNANLALFLASIVNYQSRNAQGLTSNSFGDALYSIAMSTGLDTNESGPMDPRLLLAMQDYWRGIIEFSGTYLRSGFSVIPGTIPSEGLVDVNGTQSITTMGWTKHSAVYLYTVIPVTIFALLTYAAIGFTIWRACGDHSNRSKFTAFDPTNPIHLIMVSSTRAEEGALKGKREGNLTGESIWGFHEDGIKKNETLRVHLDNVESQDKQLRKRFMLLDHPTITPTVTEEQMSKGSVSDHEDLEKNVVVPVNHDSGVGF